MQEKQKPKHSQEKCKNNTEKPYAMPPQKWTFFKSLGGGGVTRTYIFFKIFKKIFFRNFLAGGMAQGFTLYRLKLIDAIRYKLKTRKCLS